MFYVMKNIGATWSHKRRGTKRYERLIGRKFDGKEATKDVVAIAGLNVARIARTLSPPREVARPELLKNSFPVGYRPDNLDNLRKLAEQFQKQMRGGAGAIPGTIPEEDDDDVPELVAGETFEAAVNEEKAAS
ncbi:hypothetical protein C5167_007854 [Papaver somniferum]|nr:hypothetical protein C5167_007854 [Papaver somniferum]